MYAHERSSDFNVNLKFILPTFYSLFEIIFFFFLVSIFNWNLEFELQHDFGFSANKKTEYGISDPKKQMCDTDSSSWKHFTMK